MSGYHAQGIENAGFRHAGIGLYMLQFHRERAVRQTPIRSLTEADLMGINMADFSEAQSRPIVTRADALAAGLKRFFTGVPCIHGHIAERSVANWCCLICQLNRVKKAYQLDIDTYRARHRAYRALIRGTPEYKERTHGQYLKQKERLKTADRAAINAALRKKYAENDARRKRNRAWRLANKDKVRLSANKWTKENKDKLSVIRRNRRAREKNAEGSHTLEDIADIRRMQKDKCAICTKPLLGKGTIDHIIALSKGGSNFRRNIQLVHKICNCRKNAADPIEFAQRGGRLL